MNKYLFTQARKKNTYLLEKVWLYSERRSSIPPEKVKAANFSVKSRNAPAKYKICNSIVFENIQRQKAARKSFRQKKICKIFQK
jgi:hypothetical protein